MAWLVGVIFTIKCFCTGTLLNGEPIIQLPTKSICLKKVEFSDEERAFYSRLEADSRSQFKVSLMHANLFIIEDSQGPNLSRFELHCTMIIRVDSVLRCSVVL